MAEIASLTRLTGVTGFIGGFVIVQAFGRKYPLGGEIQAADSFCRARNTLDD